MILRVTFISHALVPLPHHLVPFLSSSTRANTSEADEQQCEFGEWCVEITVGRGPREDADRQQLVESCSLDK